MASFKTIPAIVCSGGELYPVPLLVETSTLEFSLSSRQMILYALQRGEVCRSEEAKLFRKQCKSLKTCVHVRLKACMC